MQLTPYHSLERVSAPASEPISLAEAKLFLRVDSSDDDVLISTIVESVRHYAEKIIGRSIASQGWRIRYRDYIPTELVLPMAPVTAISSVTLTDSDGNTTSLAASGYRLITPFVLALEVAQSASVITIDYTAGEGVLGIPVLRQAMLHHIAQCYDQRATQASLTGQSAALYDAMREVRL